MEQDRTRGARRRGHIDEDVGPAAGRQHQRAVAGRERLGRLAVEGHDPDVETLHFDRNDRALAAIDEAEPEPFVGPG